jgi:peptide/nickel transport system substrate-binding protein
MDKQPLRIDTLIQRAADGQLSRRELARRAAALGLGAGAAASLLGATWHEAGAQAELTLSFDAGATGGGGGKPDSALNTYSYILNGGSQFELNRMVDARLVTLSADLQDYVGDLAESWEISDTTATFNLHPNAMWHDGTPVTSKDVAFTLNVLTDPATTSRWGGAFGSIAGYDDAQTAETPTSLSGITTPDDHTVVLELSQVDSGLLAGFFNVNIMPEHLLGDADRATITELPFWSTERIGAGPFRFVQLVEGERIELEAFEDYHLGAPQIQKLNLLFFSSAETSLAAFQGGESLAAAMTPNDVELVEGIDGAEIVTTPAGVAAIWINTKNPAFEDVRVRQAIAYAIDKQTISETLFQGFAQPVSTEIPYIAWAQPEDANPYDYSPETATELLTEAGWDDSQTYVLWYYYPDQVTASVMEAIQQYLGAVGITIELRFDDGSGVRTQEMEEGTWHLIYGSFGTQPAPSNLSVIWGPAGERLYSYTSDAFNAEMEAALRTNDREEQATHYQAAVKILNEDAPWVWLFDRSNLIAVNTSQLTTGSEAAWGPGHIMYHNHAWDWTLAE